MFSLTKTAATGVIFSCNKTIEDVGSLWYTLAEVFSQYVEVVLQSLHTDPVLCYY